MLAIILYLLTIIIVFILLVILLTSYTIDQEFTETRMVTSVKRGPTILYSSHVHKPDVTKESKKEEIQRAKEYIKEIKRLEKL